MPAPQLTTVGYGDVSPESHLGKVVCSLAIITGMEYANERFNPVGLRLAGWSENVMTTIEEYDPVLEKLSDKYHTKVSMPPEMEMMTMLLGSAFMFHLTNTLFKANAPNLYKLARENPEARARRARR